MKDLDYIQKTDIQPNKPLVGYGKYKVKNIPQKFVDYYSEDQKKELIVSHPRKIIQSIFQGSKVIRWDSLLRYYYTFDCISGVSTRSEVFDENNNRTSKDIFAASFPHMIDVGIMGHCTHGLSGKCSESGVQCYQSGWNINRPNMSLSDFKRIVRECRNLSNQFALGGRGDPNEHENFEEILQICRNSNIIPNYTTSGFGLTDEQIEISKKYCGAVAVSWYRSPYTISAIERLVKAGVKTNIHFVLNSDTIHEAIQLLKENSFPTGINAVVFLTHKPVGQGEKSKCIHFEDDSVKELFSMIRYPHFPFKIGIDGCFVVGLINSGLDFDMRYLDTCGAARFTCYIDAEMNIHPCSFDMNDKFVMSLRDMTIAQAWHSDLFKQIRSIQMKGCPDCEQSSVCHGGCFLYKDIILCPHKEECLS